MPLRMNTRLTDRNFGHKVQPTTPIHGSFTTFVDNLQQIRTTDPYYPHLGHPTFASTGSTTTFVDGLFCFRFLDPLTCGDKSAQGSITTLTG